MGVDIEYIYVVLLVSVCIYKILEYYLGDRSG